MNIVKPSNEGYVSGKYTDLPSFDELKSLAQENPEALEALRVALVQEVINSASNLERKRRLEGLEFVLAMKRKKAKNSLQSCLFISQLMWDSAVKLAETTKRIEHF